MITFDTFIEIGNSHKVCEDYIISGDSPLPFIILADGCSKSNDSEMGARILCHLAKQYLQYNQPLVDARYAEKLGNWVIHNAEMVARQMGLKKTCLDATLIVAYVDSDNTFCAHMFGDGYILLEPTIRAPILYEARWLDYSQNAPYYLTYRIDEQRAKVYHDLKIKKTNHFICVPIEDVARGDSLEGAYDTPVTFIYNMENYHKISICSDGVASFLDLSGGVNSNKLIKVQTLLPDLFGFKNTKGEFLKRRCNRYMKQLDKMGIGHYDDFSIGTFLYEDDSDGSET